MKNLNKLISYGIYLLAFFLPWQTRWIIRPGELGGGYWEFGTISLYAIDVLIIILLILAGINYISTKKETKRTGSIPNVWWAIAVLDLFAFISIFIAPNKFLAIFVYIRLLLAIGIFWLVSYTRYSRRKLIMSLVLGASFQALLGLWQFFTQSSFASKWLGTALHDASVLGVSVIETLSGGRWLRAYGGLDHPNILGGYLAVALSLVVIELLNSSLSIKKVKLRRILLFIIFITLLSAVLFTFSRAAWLGLLVGFIFLIMQFIINKEYIKLKNLLHIFVLGSTLVILLFFTFPDLASTRLSNKARLEIKSNHERIESYGLARIIIKNNLFLGIGIGNYTLEQYIKYNKQIGEGSYLYQPVHNSFLLIISEIGIFGLLSIMAMILLLTSNKEIFFSLNYSILVVVIILMIFDHWWWSLHFGIVYLSFITGYCYKYNLLKLNNKMYKK